MSHFQPLLLLEYFLAQGLSCFDLVYPQVPPDNLPSSAADSVLLGAVVPLKPEIAVASSLSEYYQPINACTSNLCLNNLCPKHRKNRLGLPVITHPWKCL